MRLGPRIVLPLLILGLGQGPSIGSDAAAVSALKAKGLTRSGRYFVIEDEQPVLAKLKEIKPVLARYNAALARKAAAETAAAEVARLEERRADLVEQLNAMNQQINEQGFQQAGTMSRPGGGNGGGGPSTPQGGMLSQWIAQRNLVQMHLNEVASTLKALKATTPKEPASKDLSEDVKTALDAGKDALSEARRMADAVEQRYDDLGADPSVKSALLDLEKSTKTPFKLGPSDAYKTALKALDQAEKKVLAKKTPPASKKKVKSRK